MAGHAPAEKLNALDIVLGWRDIQDDSGNQQKFFVATTINQRHSHALLTRLC